jgi:hypothetical protein
MTLLDVSVIYNVFYSRVLSSSSVLQCHNYGYLFARNVFLSTVSSPTSVSQCHGYLCSPECFPHYSFINHCCVTMPGLWISDCPECFPQYNFITHFCVTIPRIPLQSGMFSALETELPRFYGRPWPLSAVLVMACRTGVDIHSCILGRVRVKLKYRN